MAISSRTSTKAIMTYNKICCAVFLSAAPFDGIALSRLGVGDRVAGEACAVCCGALISEVDRDGDATVCINDLGGLDCGWVAGRSKPLVDLRRRAGC